jgi:hypothetical protein
MSTVAVVDVSASARGVTRSWDTDPVKNDVASAEGGPMEPRVGWRSGLARGFTVGVVAMVSVVAPQAAFAQEHGEGLLPPGDWIEEQQQTPRRMWSGMVSIPALVAPRGGSSDE